MMQVLRWIQNLRWRIGSLHWKKIFHPRNKRLFRLRVWLRVRKLLVGLWWREDVKLRAFWRALPRPLAVLLIGLGLPALVFWSFNSGGIVTHEQLARVSPFGTQNPQPMDWRAAIQPLLLLISVPTAFILWAFRDYHVQATLQNQRKDVNLKAFQEIQLRGAGALEEKLPAEARERLQIAALHQLRAFLRGEFGEEFKRPAFELMLALQQNIGERLGVSSMRNQVRVKTATSKWREKGNAIRMAFAQLHDSRTNAERSAGDVLASEWRFIWRSDFPLEGRRFDLIGVPRRAILSGLDLLQLRLAGANLSGAHLEGTKLRKAHLEGADLEGAHLEGADLFEAMLEGANLDSAHLEDVDLTWAHLEGATLRWVHLEGADLSWAHLEGTNLKGANLECAKLNGANLQGADLSWALFERAQFLGATIDDETMLAANWEGLSPEIRAQHQQKLRDLGARHINDPPSR